MVGRLKISRIEKRKYINTKALENINNESIRLLCLFILPFDKSTKPSISNWNAVIIEIISRNDKPSIND